MKGILGELSAKIRLRLQWLKERVSERHIVLIRIFGLPIDNMRLLHIVEHNLMGEAKIIGNASAVVAVRVVGPLQFSHSHVPLKQKHQSAICKYMLACDALQ